MNDEQFNRMIRNLNRIKKMNLTKGESDFIIGALAVIDEMEEVLDMVAGRREEKQTS